MWSHKLVATTSLVLALCCTQAGTTARAVSVGQVPESVGEAGKRSKVIRKPPLTSSKLPPGKIEADGVYRLHQDTYRWIVNRVETAKFDLDLVEKMYKRAKKSGSPIFESDWAACVVIGEGFWLDKGRLAFAIAGHETEFGTTGNTARDNLKNPFGLGPFWKFQSYIGACYAVQYALYHYYIKEGRRTIASIGEKYAPSSLATINQYWVNGVGSLYREIGGTKFK